MEQNIHNCEHCGHPVDYDQTDSCDSCGISIFISPEEHKENEEFLKDNPGGSYEDLLKYRRGRSKH